MFQVRFLAEELSKAARCGGFFRRRFTPISVMTASQVEVRPAQSVDIERIHELQRQARHTCVRFGYEDMARMIGRDYFFVAENGRKLRGYVCAAVQQPGLAQLSGLGLANGWGLEAGVDHLLRPLEAALRRDQVDHVLHLGIEQWTVPPLQHQRFDTPDYIVSFERAISTAPQTPQHFNPLVELRAPAPDEFEQLADLDHRCFPWPWQLSPEDLINLLMMSSRLVVLDYQGILVGYACTDLAGIQAQIARLAVDPVYHGVGFGRYLLADALDFAAARGALSVTLNTQSYNQASQRLYQGFGFRPVGPRIPVMIKHLHGE